MGGDVIQTHGDKAEQQINKAAKVGSNILRNKIKNKAKKIGRKIGLAIWKAILPWLPYIILFLLILWMILYVIGALFSALPQGQLFANNMHSYHTVEDDEEKEFLIETTNQTDILDKYLVEDEPSPGDPWYNSGSGFNRPHLIDYLGRDNKFYGQYGMVQSASVLQMITYSLNDVSNEFKENASHDFHPYVYYKPSKIVTVCKEEETYIDEDGTETTEIVINTYTTEIYLMVEAYTVEGHYIYNYKEEIDDTEPELGSCVTAYKEVPLGEGTQILPNRWQRLDDWVKETYKVTSGQDISFLRASIYEGGKAYTSGAENLKWLFEGDVSEFYISEGLVPVELRSYFFMAEKEFGIPAWFLEAIALKESSFNAEAYNKSSGAWGIMQLMPQTQKTTVDRLMSMYRNLIPSELIDLYDRTSNKDAGFYQTITKDPLINILAGTLHLVEDKGLNPNAIDWESDWKQQTLTFLAHYGGFAEVPEKLWDKYGISDEQEAKSQGKLNRWCEDEYAKKIWTFAEKLQLEGGWPFFGDYPITARYGDTGIWKDYHHGVDFALPQGTPLLAVTSSKVLSTGYNGDYGNLIILSNGSFKFYYAHLSRILVKEGDEIRTGQVIGYSGNTGKSTGPHLHFEIRKYNTNQAFNPGVWLTPRPGYKF